MKKAILISALIASCAANIGNIKADTSKQENIGLASGAITGAAAGGPVGFIIGAAIGALVGSEVEKAEQLTMTEHALSESGKREQLLETELAELREHLDIAKQEQLATTDKATIWLADGLTLNLMFTTNSALLSKSDFANIEQLANTMKQFPELSLKLDGYADPRGTDEQNQRLSEQRVNSVKTAFKSFGIQPERLIAHAHGEVSNLQDSTNTDFYAMARKVSVNFISPSSRQVAQN